MQGLRLRGALFWAWPGCSLTPLYNASKTMTMRSPSKQLFRFRCNPGNVQGTQILCCCEGPESPAVRVNMAAVLSPVPPQVVAKTRQ